MKTQISRNSYQKNKRYSGVYQQQGRMLTDADWNEMVDLLKGLLADALVDVVGNGSPRAGAVSIADDRKIIPGDLYVDGVHATLPGDENIGIDKQPDLPGYIPLPGTGEHEIYADIWERPVTCLEDGELRDTGLHGADTCTRTRTMLQVKWRPEPLVSGVLPRKGNGLLSLDVHTNLEAGDPCDPCADLVSADKGRVGNYLFRVEVHKVEGSANNPATITLKWSSENGAEQFEAMPGNKMPPDFISDKYVYEFFNLTTEKHLGVHLATNFTPATGILQKTYEIPTGQTDPKQFVRRWDGYCVLEKKQGNWSLKEGHDKGAELSETVSPTAHGHVSLKNDFIVNLEALKLTLTLQIPFPTPTVTSKRTFIAGDYWLAPVRETIHSPGSKIVSQIEPQGIVHHYLRLARVNNGTVKQFQDDADRRRHTFPPLTDIHAVDVGYETQCNSGLFDATHDNVKKALDRLCQIQAEHIGFVKPCNTSLYHGKSITTVQDALALLCDIRAQQVSFEVNPNCSILPNHSDIKTVQDAIDALCKRPSGGSGCRVTVGKDGQFPTLDMALNELLEKERLDICLCLLPGNHEIHDGLHIKNADLHINISGCGSDTTRISLKNALKAQVDSFSLSNVAMEMQNPEAVVSLTDCREITLQSCLFSGFPQESALVNLDAHDRIHLTDNQFEAYNSDAIEIPRRNFGEVEGVENLGDLFSIVDRHTFIAQTEKVAGELAALNIEARKKLQEKFIEVMRAHTDELSQRDLATYEMFAKALNQNIINPKSLSSILLKILRTATIAMPATALTILTAGAATILEDNDILGLFSLYGLPAKKPLTDIEKDGLKEIIANIEFISSNTLQLRNNKLTRMVISQKIVDEIRDVLKNKGGDLGEIFDTLLFTDNIIQAPDNQFVARKHSLNTTRFDFGEVKDYADAGYVFGENAVYLGCYAPDGSYLLNLTQRATKAANLGLNIVGV